VRSRAARSGQRLADCSDLFLAEAHEHPFAEGLARYSSSVSRVFVERYWAAQDPYDPTALARLRHPSWTAIWPQSNERIPTHDADVHIHTSHPDYPAHHLERLGGSDELWRPIASPLMFIPMRITGASDVWITEAQLEYPESGRWYALASIELLDGLAWRETVYYCRAADAGPWPATYPERLPTPLPPIAASMEHDDEAERRSREAHARFVERFARSPESAVRDFFHDTAVIDRPQFGRRVTGIEGIERVHAEQRDVLPGRIRRAVASGDVLLTESQLRLVDETRFLAAVLEFNGDKVARATEYLAEAISPPDWRRDWVEPVSAIT
jgi:hypothetical protein